MDDSFCRFEKEQIFIANEYLKRLIEARTKLRQLKLPSLPKNLPMTPQNRSIHTFRNTTKHGFGKSVRGSTGNLHIKKSPEKKKALKIVIKGNKKSSVPVLYISKLYRKPQKNKKEHKVGNVVTINSTRTTSQSAVANVRIKHKAKILSFKTEKSGFN